jgi:hypothetical protein
MPASADSDRGAHRPSGHDRKEGPQARAFSPAVNGLEAVTAVYTDRFRTQLYNERVVHPGAWNKIVVVAREDDDEAILNAR